MNGLLELQRDFSRIVWGGPVGECGIRITANGLTPEQRLAVYRNNTRLSLTDALRDRYPVIARLVGGDFFDRLAVRYQRRHPPKTGCLLSFGERFAEYLNDIPEARQLPYLADTARLEWLRHESYFEADACAISASDLTDVPPACYGKLRFGLHPSVRLLDSTYPVWRIWQANLDDAQEEGIIDFNEGCCRLLIFRCGLEIETIALDECGYRFMYGLQAGWKLCEAADSAVQSGVGFDPTDLLRLCLERSLVNFFSLD
ncbi:MAG: HvfC/BufC family peptide modification chaperone [Gammaproteobacteria bacterium]